MLPHTHTHKKDGEHETANNLQFHGTFNLADRHKQTHGLGTQVWPGIGAVQPGDQLPWRAPCAQSHH